MVETENRQFIEVCLADVDSESTIVRLAAYTQFYNFIDDDRVRQKIRSNIETEKDLECRKLLQQLNSLLEKQAQESAAVSDGSRPAVSDQGDQRRLILAALADRENVDKLLWALQFSEEILNESEIIDLIGKLLGHPNSLLVAKSFHLLVKLRPAKVVEALPALLKHKIPSIRISAIKFLFSIQPEEALRLLGNLIQTTDAKLNNLSLTFMYTLPFEDMWPILISLIEKGVTEESTAQLIVGLVSTNPDPEFFRRLVSAHLLKGCQDKSIQKFLTAQLNALAVTGIISGDPASYYMEVKTGVLSRFSALTGKTFVNVIPDPGQKKYLADLPDLPSSQPSVQPEVVPVSLPGQSLDEIIKCESLSEADILEAIRKISAQSSVPSTHVSWLVRQLDHPVANIKIQAMAAMFSVSRKDLIRHLPVLARSEDFFVASQAMRFLGKIEGTKIATRLEKWLNSPANADFNAALTGLTQLEIAHSLPLIARFCTRSQSLDRIRQLLNILLINPDRSSVAELKRLHAREQSANKRSLLETVCNQIRENLKVSGISQKSSSSFLGKLMENADLKDKWDDILLSIEKIKYAAEDPGAEFPVRYFVGILLLVQSLLFCFYFFSQNSFDDDKKLLIPRKEGVVKERLEKDQKISAVFTEYDAFNRWWLVTTDKNKKLKVIIAENPQNYLPGQSFSAVVEAYSVSPAGFPLVKLKGLELIR